MANMDDPIPQDAYERRKVWGMWNILGAEYGDPDVPEEWAFIRGFSPYHNIGPEADYPPVLVTTSTRDDRVHPGHARKMVAKMRDMGHDVLYYENVEGGHAGAADNAQRAYMWTLAFRFLWQTLTDQ